MYLVGKYNEMRYELWDLGFDFLLSIFYFKVKLILGQLSFL